MKCFRPAPHGSTTLLEKFMFGTLFHHCLVVLGSLVRHYWDIGVTVSSFLHHAGIILFFFVFLVMLGSLFYKLGVMSGSLFSSYWDRVGIIFSTWYHYGIIRFIYRALWRKVCIFTRVYSQKYAFLNGLIEPYGQKYAFLHGLIAPCGQKCRKIHGLIAPCGQKCRKIHGLIAIGL